MATLNNRDLKNLRTLRRKAGGREELIRWIDQEIGTPPKRGRPRNEFFNDFSVMDGPVKGTYLLRFKIGGAPMTYCALVCLRKGGVKPPKGIGTPKQTIREFVATIWRGYEEIGQDTSCLGKDGDAITHRLLAEFRKAIKIRK
jgi:hypothetical protein